MGSMGVDEGVERKDGVAMAVVQEGSLAVV